MLQQQASSTLRVTLPVIAVVVLGFMLMVEAIPAGAATTGGRDKFFSVSTDVLDAAVPNLKASTSNGLPSTTTNTGRALKGIIPNGLLPGHPTAMAALNADVVSGTSAAVHSLPTLMKAATSNGLRSHTATNTGRSMKGLHVNGLLPAAASNLASNDGLASRTSAGQKHLVRTNGLPSAATGRALRGLTQNGLSSAATGRTLKGMTMNGLPSAGTGRALKGLTQNGLPSTAKGRALKGLTQNGLPSAATGRALRGMTMNGLPSAAAGRVLKGLTQNGLPSLATGRLPKALSANGLPTTSTATHK